MTRKAFTLVEMLVVITIIMLLISILLPSLSRVRSLARKTVCASNLQELYAGMLLAHFPGNGLPTEHAFPAAEWPGIPSPQMSSSKVFHCPEASPSDTPTTSYTIYTNQDKIFINFEAGSNCRVVPGPNLTNNPPVPAGSTQYRFDDGFVKDYDDVILNVTNANPRIATKMNSGYQGTSSGVNGTRGILSLYKAGQAVPDWADMGQQPQGASFTMNAGDADYGINSLVGQTKVSDRTIVLLDYDLLVANSGESMPTHLAASSRHLGQINVLYADGSVRASWGLSLDPALSPVPWQP